MQLRNPESIQYADQMIDSFGNEHPDFLTESGLRRVAAIIAAFFGQKDDYIDRMVENSRHPRSLQDDNKASQ